MKILVCISNVPDTTSRIQPGSDGKSADLSQVQWIINPWDELALTRAVELREKQAELFESLTVITVGTRESEPTLRKALAVGADRAIRVDTPAKSSWQVARQIASVIQKEGFDLVLTGIESSDYNGSATGGMIGAMSNYSIASNISSLKATPEDFILEQETDGGRETIRMKPPLVAIAQKGIAIEPRIPAMRGIMQARQKPLEVNQAIECDILEEITLMELPPAKAPCKLVDADKLEELVALLRNEAKVLYLKR